MQGVVKMRKPGKGCKKTDAHYYWNRSDEHDRYFFKVLTGDFHERLVSFQVQCVSCKFFFFGLSLTRVYLLRSGIFFFATPSFFCDHLLQRPVPGFKRNMEPKDCDFWSSKKNCAFCIWLVDANLTRLGTWCCVVKVGVRHSHTHISVLSLWSSTY